MGPGVVTWGDRGIGGASSGPGDVPELSVALGLKLAVLGVLVGLLGVSAGLLGVTLG